jgi:mono/diheme cytochrome c family protein
MLVASRRLRFRQIRGPEAERTVPKMRIASFHRVVRVAAAAVTALTVLAVGAGSAAAQARDPYHTAPRDTVAQDVYQGWKQYELNCARCHGEYAVGTSFAPALTVSLKDDGTVPTKELFVQVVCAGRPDKGMPAWCALGLEMDKIENIYKYVKGRADKKIGVGRPAVKAEPEPASKS